MALPTHVVEKDHQLETEADRANGNLAEHRWHWTLDGSNPQRAESVIDYARQVGRHESTIQKMVNAYKSIRDNPGSDLQQAIQLQGVKQADRKIVEAVSKATGTSVVNTRQHHRGDVDRVRNAVADARVREEDLTPEREEEVIHKTASFIAAGRKAERAAVQNRKRSVPLQVLVLEGDFAQAKSILNKTLKDAQALEMDGLDQAFIDGLTDAIDKIVALAKLVQMALAQTADVDWDAELAKIEV